MQPKAVRTKLETRTERKQKEIRDILSYFEQLTSEPPLSISDSNEYCDQICNRDNPKPQKLRVNKIKHTLPE